MTTTATPPAVDLIDHARINAELERGFRDVLLEHARMGRSVPQEGKNGETVWVTPEEIFARYGLDPNGKPLPS